MTTGAPAGMSGGRRLHDVPDAVEARDAAGSPDAGGFDAWARQRWPRLVRAAVLLGASATEAEDVAQTALVRCLQHWDKVSAADDRDAYAHRVLVNAFTAARRRRWTGERPTADLPEPGPASGATANAAWGPAGAGPAATGDAFDEVDTADALRRSLARLPDDQRAAVVLRYYAHLDERQMAEALGVAAGTVKSRLSRALKALAADPALADLRTNP